MKPLLLTAALLAFSASVAMAQMSMGTNGGMEGMTPEQAPPKTMQMTPPKPGSPKPTAAKTAPTAAPAAPMAGMPAAKTMPEPAKPAEAPKAPEGQGMEMSMDPEDSHGKAEDSHGSNGTKEMSEPPPSSMDGRRILIVFALLNAAILGVAAVLKFRRTPTTTSREVKA